jgi:hypothetical protein
VICDFQLGFADPDWFFVSNHNTTSYFYFVKVLSKPVFTTSFL